MEADLLRFSKEDQTFMQRALALAAKARGWTAPNPMVGAVVVKNGRIIGEGYHHRAGEPHAEIHALNQAGENARGATLYVTLEPCCHQGKTPPCTRRIIQEGLARVVVAMEDPNPLVAGKGLTQLRQAGIIVETGLLQQEAAKLNEVFIKYITTKQPFVVLKTAITLDGKIAAVSGDSRWITGPAALRYVHRLRHYYDGVMTGIGTILKDDPQLTCRLPGGPYKNPVRIILDSRGRTPLTAKVLQGLAETPTIIVVTKAAPPSQMAALAKTGAKVLQVSPDASGRIDLKQLMTKLGALGISSVLLEGGGQVNASAVAAGIVDKYLVFIAPKIIGGATAPTFVTGTGIKMMEDAIRLSSPQIRRFGQDLLLEYYPAEDQGENH
ncbi:MAG: bifunctional diaminohydroxyphosphoribosylaminopyrimidine deaminase/5-amino-6-(5-phosphoribosylamino)uracil reductase RibD [Bacillota bacterium]